MLFYEYFLLHLEKEITIYFKNDIVLKGVLKSVDVFLNVVLDRVQILNGKVEGFDIKNTAKNLQKMFIRGSSIKSIDLCILGIEERVTEAAMIKNEIEN
ncbi:LSM2 [Ecytonucleospora hepatopenaei]|uniref:LSM2 n=1 Tax=Ecytonucleospora hepatopenaei TaxID=646526 RepID=A0A1W0E887_9MICR|nr:LSM2 [Ecytonucleospora hepatopenaei]